MNHTPGPWAMQVFTAANGDLCPGVVGANGAAVAWLNNETDARLIAAAPELLMACIALIAHCDNTPPMGESLWSVQQIRAAIKKAIGGST